MNIKKISENPKITDSILLEIQTPDADGCFKSNPYKVDSFTIYHVERNFLGQNYGEYDKSIVPEEVLANFKKTQKEFCDDPSENNKLKLIEAELEKVATSQKNTIYYKERVPVLTVGTPDFPAWLSTDIENSFLLNIESDEDGNQLFGHFTYEWNPKGSVREGDYFLCWTWTPLPAGQKYSAHIHFTINGDGRAVSSLPIHETPENKYETLFERYLPEMFKYKISDNDEAPVVTEKLNKSFAKVFTATEDLANQLIDLLDANVLHESMLTYLSNTFGAKLKSGDPILWRRQIKESIPLYKMKGTLPGLKKAFSQAGMSLNNITYYWQVTSPFTWVETHKVKESTTFELFKNNIVLPIDPNNFELWIKPEGDDEFLELSQEYADFYVRDDGVLVMEWVGHDLLSEPMHLLSGDTIKVKYQYNEINTNDDQSIENYIQQLPLMDQRDENDQEFPPKNWNVKLIAEDDPMFAILVPVRHPFEDLVQFGWIRTEFGYSENIYNMDEYNGSTRPSFEACHIDKEFVDPCKACLSSNYSVDIGVEELSNDRMLECQEILKEFTPFQSVVHSINFAGDCNEFIQSPVEELGVLIKHNYLQNVIAGGSNPLFHRHLNINIPNEVVTRDDLTSSETVVSNKSGLAYNKDVAFFCPDFLLDKLGLIENDHVLEVLSPSLNSGNYTLNNPSQRVAKVSSSVNEPLDQSEFTFNLYNSVINYYNTTIKQQNIVKLLDSNKEVFSFTIVTREDTNNDSLVWKISVPSLGKVFLIQDVINGEILLNDEDQDIATHLNSVSYKLLDASDEEVFTSTTGKIRFQNQARINFHDSAINIREYLKINDYLEYDGNKYLIHKIGTVGDYFYILDYSDGDVSGANTEVKRKLISNGVGYFFYSGLNLQTSENHEDLLNIVNGNNPVDPDLIVEDNSFKENFMFKIGDEFYKIVTIDNNEVVLNGQHQDWTTINNGGESITYDIVQFKKNTVNVGFTVFDQLDRSGKDPVIREIYSTEDENTEIVALSTQASSSGPDENVLQEEGVSFKVEMNDGSIYEGEI